MEGSDLVTPKSPGQSPPLPNSPPFQGGAGGGTLETQLYRQIFEALSNPQTRQNIHQEFPKPTIHRRNTGYAVDLLLRGKPFSPDGPDFNFCKMLAGSEGTLAFTTALKLNLVPLPPPAAVVLAAHFTSLHEAMEGTLTAMQHRPDQCELMDKIILDCTKSNIEQLKNRWFVEGDPAALLLVEFRGETLPEAQEKADGLRRDFQAKGIGYAFPFIAGARTKQVWDLRSAGLGVVSNMPGDAKPHSFIEDTAVALEDLPAYIREFDAMMRGFGQQAVYYAHAGAGELHIKPVLNLKKSEDVRLFREMALASARLVKKYGGSLSGEHGDGRVRGEFLPMMLGEANYQLLRSIKKTWDPHGVFNPGKITDAPPMHESLRHVPDMPTPEPPTVFNFSAEGGILRAAEKCNGSGDCRRLDLSGGTMCPSYRATRNEKDTTRARANALREFFTAQTPLTPKGEPLSNGGGLFGSPLGVRGVGSPQPEAANERSPIVNRKSKIVNSLTPSDVLETLDLCLSCKGCTSECPSNVDMTTMKAEFLHQHYQANGVPFRARIFGNIGRWNGWLSHAPAVSNFFIKNSITGSWIKKVMGVAPQRSLPVLHGVTLRNWYGRNRAALKPDGATKGKLYFFCDEFSNFYDVELGMKALKLLTRLGYEVEMPGHPESGRSQLSKGLLPEAQRLAKENVRIFSKIISEKTPLVGIEPSAILGFRDEYLRLVEPERVLEAKNLAANVLTIDEFLAKEIQAGRITPEAFTQKLARVLLHGHCHQKALSSVESSAWVAGLPENYAVEVIPSGCCGMAGSFGYEAEHYEVSMKIGDLVLFPAIRKATQSTENQNLILAATGTSCRHQILDGTGGRALHPVEILYDALEHGFDGTQI